jgi:hypothetical protein
MRAVWSFWSKPFFASKGRIWREPVHHLLAWGLSHRLARKHYPETVLVTDRAGEALLVNRLGLQFSHVSTELERLNAVDHGWWALGKLVAYSLQDRPFVHIDTDVFLWKPLPTRLTSAPVFSQCPELHPPLDEWCGPRDVETVFARHGLPLPAEWEWARAQSPNEFREENCGILGGTRLDFIRYYAELGIGLVMNPTNARAWGEFSEKEGYNMLVEQFLLGACVDYHRFRPDSPFRGVFMRNLFGSFGEAFDATATARAGYTHLLGNAKTNEVVTRRLERRVQQEDREFFERCVRLSSGAQLGDRAG